jgi:hypothetical protein
MPAVLSAAGDSIVRPSEDVSRGAWRWLLTQALTQALAAGAGC